MENMNFEHAPKKKEENATEESKFNEKFGITEEELKDLDEYGETEDLYDKYKK